MFPFPILFAFDNLLGDGGTGGGFRDNAADLSKDVVCSWTELVLDSDVGELGGDDSGEKGEGCNDDPLQYSVRTRFQIVEFALTWFRQ